MVDDSVKPVDPFKDPYSLHHSDNPTAVLVSPPLNGDNYNTWVRAMKMALRAKNKLGFVDGTISAPVSIAENFSQWIRVNDMVTSWLLHSLTPELAISVIYVDLIHEIWIDLKTRFSQPNTTKLYQIKLAIADWKQDKLSISACFTKLKTLWDELSLYISVPTCSCGASKELNLFFQQDQSMKFLQGLHESFAPLRSQLLLQDPLPPVAKLYSLALQEEKQREITSATFAKPEVSALISNVPKTISSNRGQRTRPHYDHCNMDGHTIQMCYKLHGYPPRTPMHCTHCDKDGHTVSTCYKLHGYPPKKSAASNSSQPKGLQAAGLVDNQIISSSLVSPSISADQYAQILVILQQGSTPPSVNIAGPVNEKK
ncbi:uncharacterized protein LOC122655404 [Telopea speciosissima]|uniref:uncharacterized protein LOC122655404 n=1 Tax=Telopea speciosissima TaxID=54955 RepID=UPI001CC80FD7|nr:uncharacterized protein LOC122655404 [Telopea speciosissima]